MTALHITNGDCAADTLRTFLSDRVLITCDVLHDGPAPLVDDGAWYDTRARYLSDGFGARYADVRSGLERVDRMIAGAPPEQEIVLWFEHDLFDQLLLIRTLDLMVRLKPDTTYMAQRKPDATDGGGPTLASGLSRTNVSLICIDRFPGVGRFVGLGQLSAEQLASLYPSRQPVTAEQFALASEGWRAFRSDDPRDLLVLMVRLKRGATSDVASGFGRTTTTLPFLADAIHRLFEEYPSTTNGLSRSAEAVLRAVDAAPLEGATLLRAAQSAEPRPFIGDTGLFDIVHRLAAARVPLVAIDPPTFSVDLHGAAIRLTAAGRDVLAGRRDAVALNGIDEWRGGVHLFGQDRSPWRWDAERETLVS